MSSASLSEPTPLQKQCDLWDWRVKTYQETVNTVKQPFFDMAKPLADAGWFVKPIT